MSDISYIKIVSTIFFHPNLPRREEHKESKGKAGRMSALRREIMPIHSITIKTVRLDKKRGR
jgi:hypothetical protein